MKRIALAAAPLLLLLAAKAEAQTVVRTQLDSANVIMGRRNFRPVGTTQSGVLNEGRQTEFSVSLEPGTYIVAGVCDADCDDLDLTVFSGSTELASDVLDDDVPMVTFTVSRQGSHTFRVAMASCSSEPCGWGARVYAQAGSAKR
jgi:hypothetical protein